MPCNLYGDSCGKAIRHGISALRHYNTDCPDFKDHPAREHLRFFGPISSKAAAVSVARKVAYELGISSRGDRFICSVHMGERQPAARDLLQRGSRDVLPGTADTTTTNQARDALRRAGCGPRQSQKGYSCEASIHVVSNSEGQWELLIYNYHSHAPMPRLGSYDKSLRQRVADELRAHPSFTAADIAALIHAAQPRYRHATDGAVRQHISRIKRPLRPPPDRPAVLECLKFSTWPNWHQQMALSRALKCPTLPLLCLPGKGHLALLFFLRGGSLPALFLRLLPPLRVVGLPYLVQGNSSLLLRTKTELTTSPLVKLAASTKGGISL